MAEVDYMGVVHMSTERNYLDPLNDPGFPKARTAELPKNPFRLPG